MQQILFFLEITVLTLTILAALCVLIGMLLRKNDNLNELLIKKIDIIEKYAVILVAIISIPTFIINRELASNSDKALHAAQNELNFLNTDRSLSDKQKQILFASLKQEHGKIIIESIIGREPQLFSDQLFFEFNKLWDAKKFKATVVPDKLTVGVSLRVHSLKDAPSYTKTAFLALIKANLNPVLIINPNYKKGELVLLVGEKISVNDQELIFPGATEQAENFLKLYN